MSHGPDIEEAPASLQAEVGASSAFIDMEGSAASDFISKFPIGAFLISPSGLKGHLVLLMNVTLSQKACYDNNGFESMLALQFEDKKNWKLEESKEILNILLKIELSSTPLGYILKEKKPEDPSATNHSSFPQTYTDLIRTLKNNGLTPFEEMPPPIELEADCAGRLSSKIERLYRKEGRFTEALALAQNCEAGYKNLIHRLVGSCIELSDWNNLPTALSAYKVDPKTIFNLAIEILGFDDRFSDPRERLKVVIKVLDLCGNYQMAEEFKFKQFCQLAGSYNSSDLSLQSLRGIPAEILVKLADVLDPMNTRLRVQQKEITHLDVLMIHIKNQEKLITNQANLITNKEKVITNKEKVITNQANLITNKEKVIMNLLRGQSQVDEFRASAEYRSALTAIPTDPQSAPTIFAQNATQRVDSFPPTVGS